MKTLFKFVSQSNLVPFLESGLCNVGNELDNWICQLYSQVADLLGNVNKRINIRLFDLLARCHCILNLPSNMFKWGPYIDLTSTSARVHSYYDKRNVYVRILITLDIRFWAYDFKLILTDCFQGKLNGLCHLLLLYSIIVDQCGTFTGNVISSPSFDEDHDMEINCDWILYLYTNETVLITFLSIDIEESERCTKGYVEVSKLLRKTANSL